jgi:hypothetical protein
LAWLGLALGRVRVQSWICVEPASPANSHFMLSLCNPAVSSLPQAKRSRQRSQVTEGNVRCTAGFRQASQRAVLEQFELMT